MANIIRINVGGIPYSVSSEDDELYMKSLANELEHKMDTLIKAKPFLSTTMAAVMTALDCLDKAKKTEEENAALRLEVTRLNEKLALDKLNL